MKNNNRFLQAIFELFLGVFYIYLYYLIMELAVTNSLSSCVNNPKHSYLLLIHSIFILFPYLIHNYFPVSFLPFFRQKILCLLYLPGHEIHNNLKISKLYKMSFKYVLCYSLLILKAILGFACHKKMRYDLRIVKQIKASGGRISQKPALTYLNNCYFPQTCIFEAYLINACSR